MERLGEVAVLDFETTGLELPSELVGAKKGAELLEVGVVLLDLKNQRTKKLQTLHSLVRIEGEIPQAIVRLTGIRAEDVRDAPRREDVREELKAQLQNRVILAHNAEFEKKFLSHYIDSVFASDTFLREGKEFPRYLDTQDLLALTYPDAPTLRLEWFTEKLLGRVEEHRGLQDAIDTLCVLAKIAEGAKHGETRSGVVREALQNYVPDSPWLPLFEGATSRRNPFANSNFVAIGETNEKPVPFDADTIEAALRDEARGRRYFGNYRVREGQIALMRRFVAAFQGASDAESDTDECSLGKKIVLLEGGTGIGKSLAYLAAAIPYAMETAAAGDRRPVIVSTRTKLLQDQLLEKDIAAAARFLGYPELCAMSIKGRANYTCTRRLQAVLEEGCDSELFPQDRMAYAALSSMSQIRVSGEIGGVAPGIRRRFPLFLDLLRHSVSSRADQCSREQCAAAGPCAFGKKRAALARANLIVANHDLLLRWPPDYPSFTHVVVDEAHELAGVADEAYAQDLSPEVILDDFDEAFGKGKKARGVVAKPQRQALGEEEIKRWRKTLDQEFKVLGKLLGSSNNGCADEYGNVSVSAFLCPIDSSNGPFGEMQKRAKRFRDKLADLREHADILSAQLKTIAVELKKICDEKNQEERESSTLERVRGNFEQAASNLKLAFSDTPNGEEAGAFVVEFENLRSPFDRWRLVIRPISLELKFKKEFLEKLECLVAVSASLFVGGSAKKPDSFAALGELGIDMATPTVETLAVPSPFPYAEQMRVVALETNPHGTESANGKFARSNGDAQLTEETAQVIADLACELGGRTLGLFTSLKRMNAVADLLAEELRRRSEVHQANCKDVICEKCKSIEVLTPRAAGDDPSRLVERFRQSRSVLLGSRSFWQGIDVAGDALQAVVIEKYPFEVPTELRKRREALLKKKGVNVFERYALGKMLLYLKQMVGRLIRAEDDRGIVVIVEGRTDARYFQKIERALPHGSKICVAHREELGKFLQELKIGYDSESEK